MTGTTLNDWLLSRAEQEEIFLAAPVPEDSDNETILMELDAFELYLFDNMEATMFLLRKEEFGCLDHEDGLDTPLAHQIDHQDMIDCASTIIPCMGLC